MTIICTGFSVEVFEDGEPVFARGDSQPFECVETEAQVDSALYDRCLPPLDQWERGDDGKFSFSQQEGGDAALHDPEGDYLVDYWIRLASADLQPFGVAAPWHKSPGLLTSLSDQLASPDFYRTVYSCMEVAVFDGDGDKVASCSVDYFLGMYSNGLQSDGDGADWSDVRSLTVRTI